MCVGSSLMIQYFVKMFSQWKISVQSLPLINRIALNFPPF